MTKIMTKRVTVTLFLFKNRLNSLHLYAAVFTTIVVVKTDLYLGL